MNNLTDTEYKEGLERLANGKHHIYEEGCCSTPKQKMICMNTFMDLSDTLLQEAIRRGVFQGKKKELSPNRVPGETPDDYVMRMREKYFPKKGGKKKQMHPQLFGESQSMSL